MKQKLFYLPILACLSGACFKAFAQTDIDALSMMKNQFCAGMIYQHSSWKNYWEGTHKRDNANLGNVTTQMLGVMGNYGISNTLNAIFSMPYVKTKASAGQMHPMQGWQDLSLWLKWQPFQKEVEKVTLSAFALGGYSVPVSNYTPDFLPLSIGLHSRTASLRGIVDAQKGNGFITASATYHRRENIQLDRQAYYTTQMHYSSEVKMPNALQYNVRAGWRSHRLIAEAVFNQMTTLGGFDITKNNMPFPSNKMNMTTAGFNCKWEVQKKPGLSITGGGNYTLAGRNVGQSTTLYGGFFYVMGFSKR